MSMYKVNWESQRTGAAAIGTAVASMDSILADIETKAKNLLAMWESAEASSLYQARQAKWNTYANEIRTALQAFQTNLSSAADNASATEKSNAGIIGA